MNGRFTLAIVVRIASFIFTIVCLWSVIVEAQTLEVEGVSTVHGYDINGVETHSDSEAFSLSISKCLWAARLFDSTIAEAGNTTRLNCDGTNIYVYVPGAGGSIKSDGQPSKFENSASVYPGVVKVFPYHMGPIWWAYLSSCVIDATEPVPDFLGLLKNNSPAHLVINFDNATFVTKERKLGPNAAVLYRQEGTEKTLRYKIAEIQPLATFETNGLLVVIKCRVTKYYSPRDKNDKQSKILQIYDLQLNNIHFSTNSTVGAPVITGSTLITDFRMPNATVEYVNSNWLASGELKRLPSGATTKSISSTTNAVLITRIIFLVVFLCPLVILLNKFPRNKQTKK